MGKLFLILTMAEFRKSLCQYTCFICRYLSKGISLHYFEGCFFKSLIQTKPLEDCKIRLSKLLFLCQTATWRCLEYKTFFNICITNMSLKIQMVNNVNVNQFQHNITCKPTFIVSGESIFCCFDQWNTKSQKVARKWQTYSGMYLN